MSLHPHADRRWTLVAALVTAALLALAGTADRSAAAPPAMATSSPTSRPLPGPPTWPAHPQPVTAGPAALTTPTTTARPLGPPTWPAHPQPITPAPAPRALHDADGVDATTVGLGIAGALLAVSGIVAVTGRLSRRRQRVRATA